MRYEKQPEDHEVLMQTLGAMQNALHYLMSVDEANNRLRGITNHIRSPSSPLTEELLVAHDAFGRWLKGEPDRMALYEAWFCYADGELILHSREELEEHLPHCDGGKTAEHWPLWAHNEGEVVTKESFDARK